MFLIHPTQNPYGRKWTETALPGILLSTNMSKSKHFKLSDQRELIGTRLEGV